MQQRLDVFDSIMRDAENTPGESGVATTLCRRSRFEYGYTSSYFVRGESCNEAGVATSNNDHVVGFRGSHFDQ